MALRKLFNLSELVLSYLYNEISMCIA
jgi:hypothetical protein